MKYVDSIQFNKHLSTACYVQDSMYGLCGPVGRALDWASIELDSNLTSVINWLYDWINYSGSQFSHILNGSYNTCPVKSTNSRAPDSWNQNPHGKRLASVLVIREVGKHAPLEQYACVGLRLPTSKSPKNLFKKRISRPTPDLLRTSGDGAWESVLKVN